MPLNIYFGYPGSKLLGYPTGTWVTAALLTTATD